MEPAQNNRSIWSYLCCCCCNDAKSGEREALRGETPPQQRRMDAEDYGKGRATTPGTTPEKPKYVKEAKLNTNDYV